MPQPVIKLPFFKIKNNSVFYLGNYRYLSLKGTRPGSQLRSKVLFDEGILILKKPIEKGKKIRERILVVEPHLDDFALSASGYALSALAKGASISVLNIFSKTSIKKFPWRRQADISEDRYEKLRIEESLIAVEGYLGEKFQSWGLASLSLGENSETFPKSYRQDKLINNLAKRLAQEISAGKIDTVLCPMAVQGHIDHSVAFDAAIKAFRSSKRPFKLILYEDMPYARNKIAFFDRLKQIKKQVALEDFYIPTDEYLGIMADLIIIYRSQFDDVNRQQMLAIIKEDFRAAASGQRYGNIKTTEFSQHYFIIKSKK